MLQCNTVGTLFICKNENLSKSYLIFSENFQICISVLLVGKLLASSQDFKIPKSKVFWSHFIEKRKLFCWVKIINQKRSAVHIWKQSLTSVDKEHSTENYQKLELRKNVLIWSFYGPYFPAFGLNTERYEVCLRIQSECGKILTRKTPNMDTFHSV